MQREWSDDLLIGVDELDIQHKTFFRASQAVYEAISKREGKEIVEDTIAFLKDYAKWHFLDEEHYMERHRFPAIEGHKNLHVEFFEQLGRLEADFHSSGSTEELADRVMSFVENWIVAHIAEQDAQYAAHAQRAPLTAD